MSRDARAGHRSLYPSIGSHCLGVVSWLSEEELTVSVFSSVQPTNSLIPSLIPLLLWNGKLPFLTCSGLPSRSCAFTRGLESPRPSSSSLLPGTLPHLPLLRCPLLLSLLCPTLCFILVKIPDLQQPLHLPLALAVTPPWGCSANLRFIHLSPEHPSFPPAHPEIHTLVVPCSPSPNLVTSKLTTLSSIPRIYR